LICDECGRVLSYSDSNCPNCGKTIHWWHEVFADAGNGSKTTREFILDSPIWSVEWATKSIDDALGLFSIRLIKVANHSNPMRENLITTLVANDFGSIELADVGTFQILIESDLKWAICVLSRHT